MVFNASNETLNSNETESQPQSFSPHTVLFFPTLCLCLVGIPGTIVTICYQGKHIKTANGATSILLTALATYDMLSLLTTLLHMSVGFIKIFIDRSNGLFIFFCHYYVTNYLSRVPKYCSNSLLLIIAIERLCSVVKPHEVKNVFTKKVGVICIVAVTLVIPLSLLPRAFEYTCVPSADNQSHVMSYTLVYSEIGEIGSSFVWVYIITVVLFYSLPLVGIIISNIALIVFLWKRANSKTPVLPLTMDQKLEMKVTKLVLIVTFVFVISVSPLGIFFPLMGIKSNIVSESVIRAVLPVSTFLETINYSANTVIYYAGSASFRSFVKRFICKIKCKSSRVVPASSN